MEWWAYLLCLLWMAVSAFLILIILLQRGKGGGLAGALGGMGGSSAFGTKAGDVFTRITIGVFVVYLMIAMVGVWSLKPAAQFAGTDEKPVPAKKGVKDKAPVDGIGASDQSNPPIPPTDDPLSVKKVVPAPPLTIETKKEGEKAAGKKDGDAPPVEATQKTTPKAELKADPKTDSKSDTNATKNDPKATPKTDGPKDKSDADKADAPKSPPAPVKTEKKAEELKSPTPVEKAPTTPKDKAKSSP